MTKVDSWCQTRDCDDVTKTRCFFKFGITTRVTKAWQEEIALDVQRPPKGARFRHPTWLPEVVSPGWSTISRVTPFPITSHYYVGSHLWGGNFTLRPLTIRNWWKPNRFHASESKIDMFNHQFPRFLVSTNIHLIFSLYVILHICLGSKSPM